MKILRWFCILLIGSVFIHQNTYGGSILSSSGIGTPYHFSSSRSMGMGGVSIAVPVPMNTPRSNPALLSFIESTQLSLQFYYEFNRIEDQSEKAVSQYANLDGFDFAIPCGRGVSLGIGMRPWTRVDYKMVFNDSIASESYSKSVIGSGGLNAFDFSLSARPVSLISIGLTGHAYFGRIQEQQILVYENSAFKSSDDIASYQHKGFGWTAGLLVKPSDRFQIGTIFRPKCKIETEAEISHIFSNKTETAKGNSTIPSAFGIGLSAEVFRGLHMGFDYKYHQWQDLTVMDKPANNTQNVNGFSFGMEYLATTEPFANIWKRIAYRCGLSIEPAYVLDPSGNSITEKWVSLGVGFPFFVNAAVLDISLSAGIRGSVEQNGLSEKMLRLSVSITGRERWFIDRFR